jgi:WD40 repeat protein
MLSKAIIIIPIFMMIFTLQLQAHTPKNALGAVAVSPDGKTLVVGGDNRTLYVLDPDTLEVQKRIWLKTNIYNMAFCKNGKTLVMEDTSEKLYFIETGNWKVLKTIMKAGSISAAPMADMVAGIASSYKKNTIKLFSMTDGTLKSQLEFPGKVVSIGLDAAGTRLVLLAKGPKGIETKKATPKNLRGFEASVFKQNNDGRVSILAEFEVPSWKKLSEKTIFYTAGSPVTLVGKNKTLIIDYSNVNAKIEGGKISLFKAESSFNYGIGISPDRKKFLVGGLRDGTLVDVGALTMKTFKVDRLPGWPEYYKGFDFGPDGTGYAVTTAYRLVKIKKDGKIEKAVPIF